MTWHRFGYHPHCVEVGTVPQFGYHPHCGSATVWVPSTLWQCTTHRANASALSATTQCCHHTTTATSHFHRLHQHRVGEGDDHHCNHTMPAWTSWLIPKGLHGHCTTPACLQANPSVASPICKVTQALTLHLNNGDGTSVTTWSRHRSKRTHPRVVLRWG